METPRYSYYLYPNEYGDYAVVCVEDPALVDEGPTPQAAITSMLEMVRVVNEVVEEYGDMPRRPSPYAPEFSERVEDLFRAIAYADQASYEKPTHMPTIPDGLTI